MDHRLRMPLLRRKDGAGSARRTTTELRHVGTSRSDWVSEERRRRRENGQIKRQVCASADAWDTTYCGDSKIEENSRPLELKESLYIGSSELPRKSYCKEKEIHNPSPSIIARLMGLDSLPSPQYHKMQKDPKSAFHDASSRSIDKNLTRNKYKHLKAVDDTQEFKDVFEIRQPLKFEKHMDNAKNKTVPGLFTKHSYNPKHTPYSPGNNITVSKELKNDSMEKNDPCLKLARNDKKNNIAEKCFINSSGKPAARLANQNLLKYHGSISQSLPRDAYEDIMEGFCWPTEIVLLKPSLEKPWIPEKSTLSQKVNEHDRSVDRMVGNPCWTSTPGCFLDKRDFPTSVCLGDQVRKVKVSREAAAGIQQQFRSTIDIRSVKASASRFRSHLGDDNSYTSVGMSKHKSFSASHKYFHNNSEYNSRYGTSPSYLNEISMNRAVYKHLSERWKKSHRYGMEDYRDHSGTPEMLSLFDEGSTKNYSQSQSTRKASYENSKEGCSPGFCKDNWIDRCNIHLPNSGHLSSSSGVRGPKNPRNWHNVGCSGDYPMLKGALNLGNENPLDRYCSNKVSSYKDLSYGCRKPQHFNFENLENDMLSVNIGSYPDISAIKNPVNRAVKDKCDLIGVVEDMTTNGEKLCADVSVPFYMDLEVSCISEGSDVVSESWRTVATVEDSSTDHSAVDSIFSQYAKIEPRYTETSGSKQLKTLLQQPLLEEEYQDCLFPHLERMGSHIQDIQVPLQASILVSEDNDTIVFSPKDKECLSSLHLGGMLEALRNEEDREFSYFIDILIDSGICAANKDELLGACYSSKCPVDPSLFKELEKKYTMLEGWPVAERRLLFDLVSFVSSEIFVPCKFPHLRTNPRMRMLSFSPEVIAEDIWQMMVRLRKELRSSNWEDNVLDLRWLDLGDDLNVVGKEMEVMLEIDLLEELLHECLLE